MSLSGEQVLSVPLCPYIQHSSDLLFFFLSETKCFNLETQNASTYAPELERKELTQEMLSYLKLGREMYFFLESKIHSFEQRHKKS